MVVEASHCGLGLAWARAGQFRGILVLPRNRNESSFAASGNSFEARISNKSSHYYWRQKPRAYLQIQNYCIRSRHPNRTIIFEKL